jgi:hypothetical protein
LELTFSPVKCRKEPSATAYQKEADRHFYGLESLTPENKQILQDATLEEFTPKYATPF